MFGLPAADLQGALIAALTCVDTTLSRDSPRILRRSLVSVVADRSQLIAVRPAMLVDVPADHPTGNANPQRRPSIE